MIKKLLIGFKIEIEPLYETITHIGDDNSIVIEPAHPRLDGMISNEAEGIRAIKQYFEAIPANC